MTSTDAQMIQRYACDCQVCNGHKRGVVLQIQPTNNLLRSDSKPTVGLPVQQSTKWVLSAKLCEDEPGWALLPFYEDRDGTLYYPQVAWYYDWFHEFWKGCHGALSPEDEHEYRGFWQIEVNQHKRRSEEFPELEATLSHLRIAESTSTTSTNYNTPPSLPNETPDWFFVASQRVRSSLDPILNQARVAKKETRASLRVVLFRRAAGLGDNVMGLRRKAKEAVVWRTYIKSVSLFAAATGGEEQEGWRWEGNEQVEPVMDIWRGGFQQEDWSGMQENIGLGLALG